MLKFALSVVIDVIRWFAISLGVVALLNLQTCIDQQQAAPKQRPSSWRAA
ncbi:hypothetical protein P3W85_29785 [Cupriavidus basilensis]|uniref:Uncharacterized protein n=1 Tax=Cupriavidus basilensis TaxID=68895 RepID=A0ABT6AXA0_9BURK|nr:hypothetical protein [Cupriavidus basilensis]MDF3837114.1 hypothetical protein [Cupriavidus basilensis]